MCDLKSLMIRIVQNLMTHEQIHVKLQDLWLTWYMYAFRSIAF